jgi:hypothetical protein
MYMSAQAAGAVNHRARTLEIQGSPRGCEPVNMDSQAFGEYIIDVSALRPT